MNYIGTKTLNTPRLILRKINSNDYEQAFKNWTNDERVCKYVCWEPHGSLEATKKLFEDWIASYEDPSVYKWIVELKDTKEVIGTIDIVHIHKHANYVEIGYVYGPKFWGKGYATEALKAVIKFCFEELNVNLVEAVHSVENKASGRVMEKANMKYESKLRKRDYRKSENKYFDLCVYSITGDEYFNIDNC